MFDRRMFLKSAATAGALPIASNLAFATSGQAGRRGGTLTIAVNPEPTILTSAFNTSTPIAIISTKMLEGLVRYDKNLELVPELAKSWKWSSDGLTLTFNLERNVKWHDGTPFTSKDVAFSMLKVWKELHAYGRAAFANVTDVDTPDDHTVVVRLSAPAKYMMGNLSPYVAQILPRHLYERTDITRNEYNVKPVGTGPFVFKEWVKGSHVITARNPNYWGKDLPYLDGVIFRFIPDVGARSVAFASGEVQLGYGNAVPLNELKKFETSERFDVSSEGGEYTSPIFLLELNTRRPPFDNVKVRQAVLHAINREQLIRVVWNGLGKVATGPVASTTPRFYNPNTVQYPYDPKKSEALLDEAGYKKKGRTRFKIYHDFLPYGSDFQRSAEFTKQQLSRVGIDVEIRSSDFATFLRRIYTDYDFDMTNTNFTTMPDPTLGVQRLYWSKNIVKGVPYSNASGYSNPEMDKLWEMAQVEADEEKRRQCFFKIQEIAQRDLPILDLFEVKPVTVSSSKLKNHIVNSHASFSSLRDAYFKS
jgi:peptide/nickel transport system substrate-binding protein